MGAVAIEINDQSLTVAGDAGVLAAEPGFARVEGDRIVTGEAARAGARLDPRRTSNRFWSVMSLEPRSAGADVDKSAAELAYAQLDSLWRRVAAGASDAVLVVPGGYSSEQLGLLLGLAQECGIPVRALIDAAAAASVRPWPNRELVYVDAGLHRVSVTLLEQTTAEVHVRAEHALGHGLASVTDAFARRVAEHFVRATRFDPFAHAAAEQALYDRLPGWLDALAREERVELALEHRGDTFRVAAERDAVFGVAQGFCRAVVQLIAQHREADRPLVVLVSDRLAAVPGLVNELRRLDDTQIERLEGGHAARSALLAEAVRKAQGDVKLLRRMPWRAPPHEDAVAAADPAAETASLPTAKPPTHIVYRGYAYRVGPEGLAIGREADPRRRTVLVDGESGVSRLHCEVFLRDGELRLRDSSTYGTFVNERRVAGETTLERGDVIRVGTPGAELHVVEVEGAQ